jgi:hypothetical protein
MAILDLNVSPPRRLSGEYAFSAASPDQFRTLRWQRLQSLSEVLSGLKGFIARFRLFPPRALYQVRPSRAFAASRLEGGAMVGGVGASLTRRQAAGYTAGAFTLRLARPRRYQGKADVARATDLGSD